MKLICTKCNKEKDSEEFRKDQHNPTGFHCHCNECFNKSQRSYYNNNLEKVRTYAKDYYSKNKERVLALRKARRLSLPTVSLYKTSDIKRQAQKEYYDKREGWKKTRENGWKSRGIKDFTYEDYERMCIEQGNTCFICGASPTQTLHVDHNHITGKVRKLLCNNCNNGIGKLKDSISILEKALKYLQEHD